ncbi:hypothetical protein INT47_004661 [Mucor saturninus]|uniref:Uncharacterized protein n=1 Tax=Mucor saturninus TaxID=64648 RepID=A0A8H7VEX0_9FUNG|nr:hypothetical protein INT47_004661 [Mucor saturninus]
MQFKRISDRTDSSKEIQRIQKYADDGYDFSQKMLEVFESHEDEESEEAEIQHDFDKSEDLKFVEEYRKNHIGRFIWKNCYEDGLKEEPPLFHRYKNPLTLKRAYARGTL